MAFICKSQWVLFLSMLLLLLVNVYGCHVAERQALMDVKRAIIDDPVGHLNSWKGANCCTWHGISCDSKHRGFVVKLDLSTDGSLPNNSLEGTLSPSVAQLRHLRYLDLNGVNFTSVNPIPPSIGSLQSLVYLNLSRSRFSGILPPHLGNLSSLTYLDLSKLRANKLPFHDFTWISRLSSLQELNLENNRVMRRNKEGKEEDAGMHLILELNKLPSISRLRLSNCGLRSFPLSLPHVNFTSLIDLDLSDNFINSSRIPTWLFNITTLEYLNLSYNSLTGTFPKDIGQLSNLQYLHLRSNRLNGSIPKQIGNLSKLSYLDLSQNSLTGAIPKAIGQLSNLEMLHLESNNLSGPIPEQIEKLHNLTFLGLSGNRLSGSISHSMCALETLQFLNLARNRFSMDIPPCWKNRSSLKVMDLSNNNLEGQIPEEIGFLPSLESLHLNWNNLSGTIPSSLNSCTNLTVLDLMHNNLSGEIKPSFQFGFSQLRVLQLKSNRLSGYIPPHLFELQKLQVIDVSHNYLTGGIPQKIANVAPDNRTNLDSSMYYRENISLVRNGREHVYISNILQLVVSIDLSANDLSGSIPIEIGKRVGLKVLNLSNNNLIGTIPKTISKLGKLESLDLSINNISGDIPRSMANLPFLSHLNVSHNNLSGSIPRGSQFDTFNDPSAFLGNHLCGTPLERCSEPPPPEESSNKARFEESSHLWFTVGFLLSFIFGF